MRLDELYHKLLENQLDYYDRMYTLSSGKENGWSRPLVDTRREFIENRFNILKKPFVEGIPRYSSDPDWKWSNLADGSTGSDKEEFDALAELLDSYSKWPPYPHQVESIKHWQKGKNVVVATGTGSGKTECFLYPMLGQLLREARRAKKKQEVMQRGVKALVLYPMNALVADQTVRIRDLFGTLDMANKLLEKGAGRYCQFGMYTGRTQAHGWYSEPGTKKGTWRLPTNGGPRMKVKNIVDAYINIEENHPELWKRLVKDRRVPSKGNDDDWSLNRFATGIERDSSNSFKKNLNFVGTSSDRELFSRYEMHQGGLIQYALNSSDPSDIEREKFENATQHLGVPDILVTNYSMLEYMLLRPLEHVFWEDTKNWLHEELEEGETPKRLMLVLDEAHLYQGAMGTEVSMLINRLRSVLTKDDKKPKIQVIITSASLGKDDQLKKNFVADLTGVDANQVEVPAPAKTNLLDGREWSDLTGRAKMVDLLKNCDAKSESMEKGEFELLQSLCSDDKLNELLVNHYNNGGHEFERMELRYKILENSNLFISLYTALQHPQLIEEKLHGLRPHGDKAAPWSLANLAKVVLENEDEDALSRLLDLIAGSRIDKTHSDEGRPLMPIRGHIFSRGLPRLSVCPRCSTFHVLETLRCDNVLQNGDVCNARPFELVYGRSTGVAFLNLWLERMDSGKGRDGLVVSNKTQFVWSNPVGGTSSKKRIALASWRCTKEHPYTHILDMDKGKIIPKSSFDLSKLDLHRHAFLKVAGFENGNFSESNLWKNRHGIDEEFFDQKCPETKRNHTHRWARQVSNLETRGNEAFSGLIDGLMQLQDKVPDSDHLPNSGKKCLIFSDSRQQAANVAVELGQLSNHDEARRLLMELLHQDWFKNLESMHKSVAGMYPWYALFCGSKGKNPFAGGDYSDDRTLFSAAAVNSLCSILASFASEFSGDDIEFNENRFELIELINSVKPKQCTEFNMQGLDYDQRARHIISEINSLMPWKSRPDPSEIKLYSTLTGLVSDIDTCYSINEIEQLLKEINEKIESTSYEKYKVGLIEAKETFEKALTTPLVWGNFDGLFYRIRRTLTREWLLSNSDLIPLFNQAIKWIQTSQVEDFINLWNALQTKSKCLPVHQKEMGRWTDSWSHFMIRILFDGEYGIEEIGLGHFQINDEYWNKIDDNIRKIFPEARYLIPRMFTKSFFSGKVEKSTKLKTAIFSEERMPAFNPITNGESNPFTTDPPGAEDMGKCQEFVSGLYKCQDNVNQMFLNKLISLLSEKNILTGAFQKAGLNAEAIEIIPIVEGSIKICSQCYRPRLTPDEDKTHCGSCQTKEFIESDSNEFSKRFQSLRIDSWRKGIQNIINGQEEAFLLRAEEHTAQIGDKLDDSDLYSPAELHELQFQDLPVPDSTSVINSRSSLPPIDVLSCTTTMEVGIDIGSLTCVALRSMPPHSANYQQRIGRAGRGASEVSIALTWADNSAYAQQLFGEPERLLHHPDSPPILYMENRRIQQRHFHASLLQLFMKHRPYIRDLLIFDGMADEDKVVTPNMVESLGLVREFFNDDDHPFGFEAFKSWVKNNVDRNFISTLFASTEQEIDLYEAWKNMFIKRMQTYREEF